MFMSPSSKYWLLIFIILTGTIACKKEESNRGNSGKKPKEIVVITQDPSASGGNISSLFVLEANGSVRWKKESWGGIIATTANDSGVLVVTGITPDHYHRVLGYDINSGSKLWSDSSLTESLSLFLHKKDTLYGFLTVPISGSSANHYVVAYSSKTGLEFWRTFIPTPYGPYTGILDDKTIYYVYFDAMGTILVKFDLNSRSIIWSSNISLVWATVPTRPVMSSDKIFIADNLNRMCAFSKASGALLWRNQDKKFDQAIYNNGYVYTSGTLNNNSADNGMYCLDPNSGAIKWFQRSDYLFSTPEFAAPANSEVILAGSDSISFVKSFDPFTGSQKWRANVQKNSNWIEHFEYPISTGSEAYALNVRISNAGGARLKSRIFIYDINSGSPVDSIDLNRDIIDFDIYRLNN